MSLHTFHTGKNEIRTGDVLLFSSNTSTGFLTKLFTSSIWNHVGIAIRIRDDKTISITNEGTLYVLEINTWPRLDAVSGKEEVGAAYSDYDWVCKRYNTVAVRKLREKYRSSSLITSIPSFKKRHGNVTFTSTTWDYFATGIGIQSQEDIEKKNRDTMFCSEYIAMFYLECILPIVEYVDKCHLDNRLDQLFGATHPTLPQLYIPDHFATEGEGRVFDSDCIIVYTKSCNFWSIILPLIIIAIFFMVVIAISLK